MTNLLRAFAAIILILAVAAATKTKRNPEPATLSQNPVPACPPFCDPDPNTGLDTAAR